MPEHREASIGEVVDATKTVAEAVETGGASLAADPMATARLVKEAPVVVETVAKKAGKGLAIGCLVQIFIFVFVILLATAMANPDAAADTIDTTDANYAQSGNLSEKVPPNFATLFKEAAAKFELDPAIVAGIYLTEHHTDSFGKDIPSLDAVESGCESNSSGARGPMQIIDSTWTGTARTLKAAGIASPDRCKYRDAIWGGAAVIKYKIKSQPDTRRECKVDKDGKTTWNDACIKAVGRSYCGACDGPACGTHGYNYCDQMLRHYKLVSGSLSYLPPLLINDREERKCVALNLE